MPVDVSRCVCQAVRVSMTDEERAALAALVKAERVRQYRTMKAAYLAAGVNPATWGNVEAGRSAKPDKVAAIVHTLWPSSGGDWRKVSTSATADRPLSTYTDRALLDELEARLTERGRERGGDTPATNRAAESAAAGKIGEEPEVTAPPQLPLEASPPPPPVSRE